MKYTVVVVTILFITLKSALADFPVGHWSNKKDGFKTITFGLRSDGAGYISPSMAQLTTVVRWTKDGDSIKIKIAAPPENPTITFLPTSDPKIGKLKLSEQETQMFYLVDEKEPDDLEALAKAKADKEAAKLEKSRILKTVKITDQMTLLNQVKKFASITEGMGSCWITANSWPTSIQLKRTNERISVMVKLEESLAKKHSPNLVYSYCTKEPKSTLPKTVYVPIKKREQLRKWAAGIKLKHDFAFFQAEGTWGLEGHFAYFSAYIDEDPASLAEVVKYIQNHIFEKQVKEFEITHVKRIIEQNNTGN